MNKIVYTLKKRKDTNELHLFEAALIEGKNECSPKPKSICKKMDLSEGAGNIFACQSEESTRLQSAKQGRIVCGTCISHLYETY